MYDRQVTEYYRAKIKAARMVVQGWVKPDELPSNAEIREQLQLLAQMLEGDDRLKQLKEMRIAAWQLMKLLDRFHPRLIGSVLTGHTRRGSDIDLHLYSDSLTPIVSDLEHYGYRYDVIHKQVKKPDGSHTYRHIMVNDRFRFELTVYPLHDRHIVPKSSITGKAMERVTTGELRMFLEQEYPELELQNLEADQEPDRFLVFESLLLPLEQVRQNPQWHPEGDALYHSLQVFDLANQRLPYDEEFLLAALLHDVGKAIDPHNHVSAGLEALAGLITPRTYWLIEHHMDVHQLRAGTLGHRAKLRLQENESYEDLLLLGECDRLGRRIGVSTPDVTDALNYIRNLDAM
jgi:hypothetical protein